MAINYEYQSKLNEINEKLGEVKALQHDLMLQIINDHNGGEGGLFGTVKGVNGTFDAESIYGAFDPDVIGGVIPMVHCDFPAFEADIEFDNFGIDEQNQILELVITELRKAEF